MLKVYYADAGVLNDDALFLQLSQDISEERKSKLSAFKCRKDKNLCLAAAILLGEMLKPYGLNEKDMAYGYTEHGKPFFKNVPDLRFSVCHSGTLCAVACCDGFEVGIDIEKVKDEEKFDYAPIAERFFCTEEQRLIQNSADKNGTFFRIWTAKESYMKYLSAGFSAPMDSFCVKFGRGMTVSGKDSRAVRFFEIKTEEEYVCTLCASASCDGYELYKTEITGMR